MDIIPFLYLAKILFSQKAADGRMPSVPVHNGVATYFGDPLSIDFQTTTVPYFAGVNSPGVTRPLISSVKSFWGMANMILQGRYTGTPRLDEVPGWRFGDYVHVPTSNGASFTLPQYPVEYDAGADFICQTDLMIPAFGSSLTPLRSNGMHYYVSQLMDNPTDTVVLSYLRDLMITPAFLVTLTPTFSQFANDVTNASKYRAFTPSSDLVASFSIQGSVYSGPDTIAVSRGASFGVRAADAVQPISLIITEGHDVASIWQSGIAPSNALFTAPIQSGLGLTVGINAIVPAGYTMSVSALTSGSLTLRRIMGQM